MAAALVLVSQSVPVMYGYVTNAPVPRWLGLATLGGRDAIQLGDGCATVVPGVNVLIEDNGELQVVDPIKGVQPTACVVVNRIHMSDTPCATSQVGVCDVAFS
jgi:hypothetical protein